MTVMPAQAKTYYTTPSGHSAVRYNSWDIPSSLRPYISQVEYDLVYSQGYGYGVRLYLTTAGMQVGQSSGYADWFAWYIRVNPEWASGGRSENSVGNEIQFHCQLGVQVMAIEYYYNDLGWYYQILFGP
ncbi:MAG: hypothetical protein KJI70_02425 [Patescibacteria group bacterium]|nr:hypothetical protein [Patescibacteria group bacterium]